MADPPIRIVVADDDPDIRTYLELTLELSGFAPEVVADGAAAVAAAQRDHPALVLLDLMMPGTDGLEATRQLRSDPSTSDVPIILVTAKASHADRIVGLDGGADDYITKPFDPDELIARVRAALRRSSAMRQVSPLSGLPGNPRIEAELLRRGEAGEPFALLYCDLTQFKAYNDHYGFLRGDGVLRGFADLLRIAVRDLQVPEAFVGHVGGDDFVVVCAVGPEEQLAGEICRRFDELAPSFYDAEDRERGYIEVADRSGTPSRFGLVSVAVGVVLEDDESFGHVGEAVTLATEMKAAAKRSPGEGSCYAVDRRER